MKRRHDLALTDDLRCMSAPEIVLDLSRLLSRVLHPTPTGVDRVELAYARGLLDLTPDRLHFAAVHPIGIYGRLPREDVLDFLDAIEERWENYGDRADGQSRRSALAWALRLRPRAVPTLARGQARRVYVQATPNNLTRPKLVAEILRREQARFVCLVHDLIPLEYPEYARADGARLHAERINTIVRNADGIVANSYATMASLQPWIAKSGRVPITAVAHLGTATGRIDLPPAAASNERPYFVCIGTIEPRKNHLLLLNIWRRMAEQRGADAVPKLVLIGRRGWENEQVVDMLDRCPSLVGCVEELGRLPDCEARALLAGSRGLLLPSFAEGYGMPITEALEAGVPVLCSDLPALREAGAGVPDYLDPLDGPGWQAAIEALETLGSASAVAQQQRRASWQAPGWTEHLAILLNMLHEVGA